MPDQSKETPADKLKREKAEKAEQDKLDAEKKQLEESAAAEAEAIKRDEAALAAKKAAEDAEKKAAEDKEADEFEPSRLDFPDDGAAPNGAEAHQAAKALEQIAIAYPLTTPDEHVVFGFAGQKFTLGQLRSLFNLKRGR